MKIPVIVFAYSVSMTFISYNIIEFCIYQTNFRRHPGEKMCKAFRVPNSRIEKALMDEDHIDIKKQFLYGGK